jgi:hypothetical protein
MDRTRKCDGRTDRLTEPITKSLFFFEKAGEIKKRSSADIKIKLSIRTYTHGQNFKSVHQKNTKVNQAV